MIKKNVEIELTPEELAAEFARMNSDDQALFFSELSRIVGKWDTDFIFQLDYICNSKYLTENARVTMREIGNYAYKTEIGNTKIEIGEYELRKNIDKEKG